MASIVAASTEGGNGCVGWNGTVTYSILLQQNNVLIKFSITSLFSWWCCMQWRSMNMNLHTYSTHCDKLTPPFSPPAPPPPPLPSPLPMLLYPFSSSLDNTYKTYQTPYHDFGSWPPAVSTRCMVAGSRGCTCTSHICNTLSSLTRVSTAIIFAVIWSWSGHFMDSHALVLDGTLISIRGGSTSLWKLQFNILIINTTGLQCFPV